MLTACAATPETPISRPVRTVSASPSATLSLSAALSAYRNYAAVGDVIAQDGGRGVERLQNLVTTQQFNREKKSFAAIRSSGNHQSGPIAITKFQLQEQRSERVLTAYVCINLSRARVVTREGKDVTPASRKDLQTLVVTLDASTGVPLVSGSSAWSGDSVC